MKLRTFAAALNGSTVFSLLVPQSFMACVPKGKYRVRAATLVLRHEGAR